MSRGEATFPNNKRRTNEIWTAAAAKVAREDFESSDDFDFAQLDSFINVSFEDDIPYAHKFTSATNPEATKEGYRVVWVENSFSKQLVRVPISSIEIEQRLNIRPRPRHVLFPDSNQDDIDDPNKDISNSLVENTSAQQQSMANSFFIPRPVPLVKTSRLSKHTSLNVSGDGDDDDDDESSHDTNQTSSLFKVVFLFVQGLLTGFAFTTLYAQSGQGAEDKDFLNYYQPIAFETRRLFFILTTIATVGACDTFLSIYSTRSSLPGTASATASKSPEHLNPRHLLSSLRTLDLGGGKGAGHISVALVMAVMYIVSFVLSLAMSRVDILIAIKFGVVLDVSSPLSVSPDSLTNGVKVWVIAALNDKVFREDLSVWRALDIIRFLCCMLGWIGACWLQALDMFAADERNRQFASLYINAAHWKLRASQLEGTDLEDLDLQSLQKLSLLLQIGADRAMTALKTVN